MVDKARGLANSVCWKIGEGRKLSIMEHIWLRGLQFSRWTLLADTNSLIEMRVFDFLLVEGRWDIGRLHLFFQLTLIEQICGVPIYSEFIHDEVELLRRPLERSITAMDYAESFPSHGAELRWLDRLKQHPRGKLFWWRLLHDAIPTCNRL